MPGPEQDDSRALVPARPLTRRDVARLYRHELDPAELAPWLERATRLRAPWAPPSVDLVPNGTGWLLSVGGPSRVRPQVTRGLAWLSGYMAMIGATNLIRGWDVYIDGLLGGSVLLAIVALSLHLSQTLAPRSLRHQLAGARQVHAPDSAPAGTLVRVTGVVAEQATIPALFSGKPAVLCRNRIGDAEEVRGIDFALTLDSGQRLKVCVYEAMLLDRPRRSREPAACGPVSVERQRDRPPRLQSDLTAMPTLAYRFVEPWRYESFVGPGDRIEVCGLLKHAPSPDGEAAPGRGVPMRTSLSSGPGVPLLVRKL